MRKKKGPVGTIEVMMASEEFNSIITILDEIILSGKESLLGSYSARLKTKMLRYSRRFIHKNTKKSVTYFYENEAALLLKLLAFYCDTIGICGADYYEQIGKAIEKTERVSDEVS